MITLILQIAAGKFPPFYVALVLERCSRALTRDSFFVLPCATSNVEVPACEAGCCHCSYQAQALRFSLTLYEADRPAMLLHCAPCVCIMPPFV